MKCRQKLSKANTAHGYIGGRNRTSVEDIINLPYFCLHTTLKNVGFCHCIENSIVDLKEIKYEDYSSAHYRSTGISVLGAHDILPAEDGCRNIS